MKLYRLVMLSLMVSRRKQFSVAYFGSFGTRLNEIRKRMKDENVAAIIVPSEDPHMSEYPSPFHNRREFISGFTGSAGAAVITNSAAALFTDGRYFQQAERELDSVHWVLMKLGLKGVPTPLEYLTKNLPQGSIVAYDPEVHCISDVKKMTELLEEKGICSRSMEGSNWIDSIWGDARPQQGHRPVRSVPLSRAGVTVQEKLNLLREKMSQEQVGTVVLSALDQICWLFNIRGCDSEYNQMVLSYALISKEKSILFVDQTKLPESVRIHLQQANVSIEDYDTAISRIGMYAAQNYYFAKYNGNACKINYMQAVTDMKPHDGTAPDKGRHWKIWLDEKKCSQSIYRAILIAPITEKDILLKQSCIDVMKACKNDNELAGIREAHLKDAVSVITMLSELEKDVLSGTSLNEIDIDSRLLQARKMHASFLEPSFATIAGVGGNGAVVHYRAIPQTSLPVTTSDMVLIDSGGHYEEGTTDITRTVHFGNPTDHQKEMFTRVLKGHIALSSQAFPSSTPGCLLDALARQHLWSIGKDYAHGTGHGVGASLCVHEGPQRISKVLESTPLMKGMVVSIEPGYYEPNSFGIRIENLVEVVVHPEHSEFLKFRPLTLVPIQKCLIDINLLNQVEIDWINSYHQEVRCNILPLISSSSCTTWLLQATDPLQHR